MSFLDTEPASIDQLDFAGAWDRFHIDDPRRKLATLRELRRADVPMTLGRAGTPAMAVSVWAVDEDRARLHLHLLSGNIPTATRLAEHGSLWAAGYLQGAKVQFNVRALAGESRAAPDRLSCAWPQMMFHLPRRRVVRVRRVAQQAPQLHFEHPLAPELRVSHRLLDISTEGCAFVLPPDALPLSPGLLLRAAELELDDQHFVFTDLRVQHLGASRSPSHAGALRVGGGWTGMPPSGQETLQRWIRAGHRRRDWVSLRSDS
jgi:c-di-GMP-binding flagellar brake protein YcgR